MKINVLLVFLSVIISVFAKPVKGSTANEFSVISLNNEKNSVSVQSDYNLVLDSEINILDDIISFEENLDLTFQVSNSGQGDFSGQMSVKITNQIGDLAGYFEAENVTITSQDSQEISISLSFEDEEDEEIMSDFAPGLYSVSIAYKSDNNQWVDVDGGSYVNSKGFRIYYSEDLEINSEFEIIPSENGLITQGQNISVNVSVLNTTPIEFNGKLNIVLSSLSEDMEIGQFLLNENNLLETTISSNGSVELTFDGTITVPAGNYYLGLLYGITEEEYDYYPVGSTLYLNPIIISVVGNGDVDLMDIYEENNTPNSAYELPIQFDSGNTLNIQTTGSDFHEPNDFDFYKLNLEAGYDYTISARLQDSDNSNDGGIYTANAMFSYSILDSEDWSDVVDYELEQDVVLENGGVISFGVIPSYNESFLVGSYQLDIQITRQILGVKDFDVENRIKLYPNPVKDRVTVDLSEFANDINKVSITNVNGQMVKKVNVDNSQMLNISLNGFTNGVYFMQIYSTNGVSTKKFIVKN